MTTAMAAMTTREFDQVLAAFSFVLERAISQTPLYFDRQTLQELQKQVETMRLAALEKESDAQLTDPDFDQEAMHWMGVLGRDLPSDK